MKIYLSLTFSPGVAVSEAQMTLKIEKVIKLKLFTGFIFFAVFWE